jgi:hypothetical protein
MDHDYEFGVGGLASLSRPKWQNTNY